MFVVLAIRYPKDATFKHSVYGWGDREIDINMRMASSLSDVMSPRENLPAPDKLSCDNRQWFEMCDEWSGKRWYFDKNTGWLYMRLVAPGFYNRNDRERFPLYSRDGVELWGLSRGYDWRVEVACSGCAVQKRAEGIDFYQVPDEMPPSKFKTEWGPGMRKMPNAPPRRTQNQCKFDPDSQPIFEPDSSDETMSYRSDAPLEGTNDKGTGNGNTNNGNANNGANAGPGSGLVGGPGSFVNDDMASASSLSLCLSAFIAAIVGRF